jgi:hypothetical protein
MKTLVALVVSLVLPGWLVAQTPAAKAPVAPAAKATAPAKAASGVAAKAGADKGKTEKTAKKEEAPAKIEGMEIGRGEKGFLGLQIVDGNFKLNFYDAKKKPQTPDLTRAVLRWNPSYKPQPELYTLGPGGGKFLTLARTVRPPYTFKLFIGLYAEGAEQPAESYVVDFRQ